MMTFGLLAMLLMLALPVLLIVGLVAAAAALAPELTRLYCPIDDVPLTELQKPTYHLRAERLTAIGYGDDKCRFRFTQIGTG